MGLQVFNPPVSSDEFVTRDDSQKLAEQMVARCLAELKERDEQEKQKSAGKDPLAAANQLLADLKRQRALNLKLKDFDSGREILAAANATQVTILLLAIDRAVDSDGLDYLSHQMFEQLIVSLLRKKLEYSDDEIVRMLVLLAKDSIIQTSLPLPSLLSNVERHVSQHGLGNSVRQQLKRLTKHYGSSATYAATRKAGERIAALLELSQSGKDLPCSSGQVVAVANHAIAGSTSFDLKTGEAWTDALLVTLGRLDDDSRNHWHDFLAHCSTAKSSKPTKKFLKRSQEVLNEIGTSQFVDVVSPTLLAIGKPGESQRFNYGGRIEYGEASEIHDTHVDRLRGIVWTTSLVDDESLIGIVGDAAEKCFEKIREVGPRSPKIGNACLIALSALASETAVAQLSRLKARAKHTSTKKQIARAFTQAATNAGMTETDLIELGVPSFGMSEPGCYSESIGEFTAEATIHAHRKTELVWRRSEGKTQKSVPAAVKKDYGEQLKSLKKKLKEIDKLMPAIRLRVEQLFLNERSWSMIDFRNRFLNHPVVGVVARKLIWNIGEGKQAVAAIWHDGDFVTSQNESVAIDDETSVSIWHPMTCSAQDVLVWRQWLDSHQVTQPFKQAHREIYILTDAERATTVLSNRFASHIIRQHQFAALCQQRGWRFDLQGDWDSWNAPFLDLPQFGLRVEFYVDPMEGQNDVTPAFVYTHLATDQIQFAPLEDGDADIMHPVPLEEVPALVFSEVMRDVDLFVGVTSIGNDPEWRERAADGEQADYWEQFSFGDLSQTGVTRKQILEMVVPRLSIADQCSLDGRFLIVEGQLRTYKIHIGSGNVLMSPNDRYLCIVQKRGSGAKRTDNLYLPFDGDNMLSLILSKAFLLAEDQKIKDRTIVNQIRDDRP